MCEINDSDLDVLSFDRLLLKSLRFPGKHQSVHQNEEGSWQTEQDMTRMKLSSRDLVVV